MPKHASSMLRHASSHLQIGKSVLACFKHAEACFKSPADWEAWRDKFLTMRAPRPQHPRPRVDGRPRPPLGIRALVIGGKLLVAAYSECRYK